MIPSPVKAEVVCAGVGRDTILSFYFVGTGHLEVGGRVLIGPSIYTEPDLADLDRSVETKSIPIL